MKLLLALACALLLVPSAAAADMSTGLTNQGYGVRIFNCETDIWSDGVITEMCYSVKWCKGTTVKPRECVRVAPWTRGTRSR